MENNKVFNIKGLYSSSLFQVLGGGVAAIIVSALAFSVASTEGLFLMCVALVISAGSAIAVYCMYKDYENFQQAGITVDTENDKFIYPISTRIDNFTEKNIREIHLSSIFAISTNNNVVTKSDGKVKYYYNISIQSSEVDYSISYSFYSSGARDRLYSIIKLANGLN